MIQKRTIGTIGYMGGLMSIPEPFAWSWGAMREFTPEAVCQSDEQIKFCKTGYSLHSAARNDLVSQTKGDWLLQLDTDLEFEPDFCARLIRAMVHWNLDIVTGLYAYKSNPSIPIIFMQNPQTGRHEHIGQWDKSQDLIEVDSAGAGCLLVRKKVYEHIVTDICQPPFEMTPPYGEDHSFFIRARKLGYKAYCAWRVQAAHLGYDKVQHRFENGLPILNDYTVTGFGTRSKGEQHAN